MATEYKRLRRHSIRAVMAVVVACMAGVAAAPAVAASPAEEASSCPPRSSLPPSTVPAAVDAWQAVLPLCQRDAGFLAQLGHIYLEQGRPVEAADHLERALLFDPDLLQARFDYALALAALGDNLASVSLVDSLLVDPALPARARSELRKLLAASQPAGQWQHRFSVAARLGHDSNLAGAPNLRGYVLSIPGLPLEPIDDPALQAKPGMYRRVDAQLDLRRDNADGSRWDATASLRNRRSHAAPEANSNLGDINIERSHLWLSSDGSHASGYHLSTSMSGLQTDGGTRYTAVGISPAWGLAWRQGALQGCQARLGGDLQYRHHISNGLLSGRYAGAAASLSCESVDTGSQWTLVLRHGADNAIHADRPGGRQKQSSLRVAGFVRLDSLPALAGLPGGILGDVEIARFGDRQGYRSYLEDNRVRTIDRLVARIEYRLPIFANALWTIGAEWLDQRATISLFRSRSQGPYTAVRIDW